MRKFVATILLLLAFTLSAFSQVQIKKEHRISNQDFETGYCAWCCLETIGRHYDIECLNDLTKNRSKEFTWTWNEKTKSWEKSPYVMIDYGSYKSLELRSPGPHQALIGKLNALKVKYRYQNYYNYDKTIIKNAIKNKQPCLVVVKCYWGKPSEDSHAIIILNYNDDGIEFLDPNDIKHTYTATHQWFNHYWMGYVLIIDK
jgi:hypothetical protein